VCADARRFALAVDDCAAAVSTFDSVNHLLTIEDLDAAFGCTAAVLRGGAAFVFDINTEAAYASEWGKESAIADQDAALFVRGTYSAAERLGRTNITMFRLDGGWQRTDIELRQRCYDPVEVARSLTRAGFGDIEVFTAADAGMAGDIAVGRVFVRARRSPRTLSG
jgi:hypothetical protein